MFEPWICKLNEFCMFYNEEKNIYGTMGCNEVDRSSYPTGQTTMGIINHFERGRGIFQFILFMGIHLFYSWNHIGVVVICRQVRKMLVFKF